MKNGCGTDNTARLTTRRGDAVLDGNGHVQSFAESHFAAQNFPSEVRHDLPRTYAKRSDVELQLDEDQMEVLGIAVLVASIGGW